MFNKNIICFLHLITFYFHHNANIKSNAKHTMFNHNITYYAIGVLLRPDS
jgi:hypothetical protein